MRRCQNFLKTYGEYTSYMEPPVIYDIWCGIATVAAALQRRTWVPFGRGCIYPNMFVVLVSEPGRSRKTTALRAGKDLLRKVPNVNVASASTTIEALMCKFPKVEEAVRITEAEYYIHSSIVAFSAELSSFLRRGDEKMLDTLTDWYDCEDHWVNETKNVGVDIITGVCFGLLGATTPEYLCSALPSGAIGGGFTSRVIFIYSNDKKRSDPDPPSPPQELVDDLVYDLTEIASLFGPFTLTKAAREYMRDWYMAHENTPSHLDYRFDGYMSRKQTHLFKIAMALSASRGSTMTIEVDDIGQALTLLDSTEHTMPFAFGGVGRSEVAPIMHKIMELLRKTKVRTRSELLRVLWRDLKPTEFDQIMATLENMRAVAITYKGREVEYKWIAETKSPPRLHKGGQPVF